MHTCLSESKPIFRFFRPAFVAIITRITKVSGEKREKSVVCQQSQKPVMLLSGVVVVGYSNPIHSPQSTHTGFQLAIMTCHDMERSICFSWDIFFF